MSPTVTWNDRQLPDDVLASSTWNDICRQLSVSVLVSTTWNRRQLTDRVWCQLHNTYRIFLLCGIERNI